jgi:hypothetical protein
MDDIFLLYIPHKYSKKDSSFDILIIISPWWLYICWGTQLFLPESNSSQVLWNKKAKYFY